MWRTLSENGCMSSIISAMVCKKDTEELLMGACLWE